MEPRPTHLDTRDPAMAGARDIREEADRAIEAYGDRQGLVLLVPEERWSEFLELSGARAEENGAAYRGATFRPAAVTALVAQEGF